MSQLSLEQAIRRNSLSAMLSVILAVSVLIALISFSLMQDTVKQSHIRSLESFSRQVSQALSNLQSELTQLSQNDLIINALIDERARQDYLPFFFESFSITGSNNEALLYTDFQAQEIISNARGAIEHWQRYPAWQTTVLNKGHPYTAVNTQGIFIAVPVFYAKQAEGALLLHLPRLASVLHHIGLDQEVNIGYTLLDQSGTVLHQHAAKGSKQDALLADFGGTISYQIKVGKMTYLSEQSALSAYANFLRLISYFVLAFSFVCISGYYIVRVSAQSATRPLNDLKKALDSATNEHCTLHYDSNDVREVRALKRAYNNLFTRFDSAEHSIQRFEGIINAMSEYILVCDHQGDVILWNIKLDSFISTLAPSVRKITRAKHNDLLPEEIIEARNLSAYEKHYQLSNGQQACVSWQCRSFETRNSGLPGYVYVGKDLSHQKAMQAELQIKNHAIDEAYTAIFIADLSSDIRISYVNNAFVELTRHRAEDIINHSYSALYGPDTRSENIKQIQSAMANARPLTLTHIAYKADGESFHNQLTLSPIKGEAQHKSYVLGLLSDVSQRERLNSYLEQAKIKAEESAELKARFLASMSHEIRTPMNGVLGMLHLLLDSELEAQQKHHAILAKSSAESLLSIIDDILDFSKIEAGKLTIESHHFDLPLMLAELCKTHSLKARQNGTEILLDLSELQLRKVNSDPVRIRQVISNLLGNAIKFTKNGCVCVKAWYQNDASARRLYCSITDTGIGVPEERQAQIFDSFTQADNSTTRNYGGTGLGLTICKQLVQAMGGDIQLTSQIDIGSNFCFYIKLDNVPSQDDMITRRLEHDYRALVIDPLIESASNTAKSLQAFGIKTLCATSMTEAKNIMAETSIDLCFIDSDLVDNEGARCVTCILNGKQRGPRLIIVTSIDVSKSRFQAYEQRATTLVKPLTLDELDAVIQDLPNVASESVCSRVRQIQASPREITAVHTANSEAQTFKILLVEDNAINQIVAKTMLEKSRCRVDIAENGKRALEQLNAMPANYYDIVFMDCQMPVMDGYEATKSIRRGEAGIENRTINVIALTANAVSGDKAECLAAGMDDYLSKPINHAALQSTLAKVQREQGPLKKQQ